MASVQDLVKQILLAAHPVGSYYWSSESTDPGTLFGRTWERVKGRFVYASVADTAGATGGASSHAITVAEMPAHTHTRGTMEIKGSGVQAFIWGDYSSRYYTSPSGAFSLSNAGNPEYTSPTAWNENVGARRPLGLEFTGSAGWTGATSSTGGGSAMSIMPPYVTAFCWRRTA